MTLRAVIIGLAAAAAICGLTFLNDFVLRQTFLVGNYMPVSVYGGLLLFLLIGNPLLLRSSKRLALKGSELAVIVALTLAACCVPGRGLMHYFTTFLMLPHHNAKTSPGWKAQKVLETAPRRMLAGVSPEFRPEDILDLEELCSKLTRAGEDATPSPAGRVWELLPPEGRAVARAVAGSAVSPDDLATHKLLMVEALNALLADRGFYREADFKGLALSDKGAWLLARLSVAERPGPEPLSDEDIRYLNRHLVDAAFPGEVLDIGSVMDEALNKFIQGADGKSWRGVLGNIPWHAWTRTLLFWIPLLLAFFGAMIGLALVVHRQWTRHEQLPYPIAKFAHSLLPVEGGARGGVFSERLFWIGALAVLFLHMNNFACMWWPKSLIAIPRHFDFSGLIELFPTFREGGGTVLLRPQVFFTAVGFAYFLSTDVSLSLGIAPFLFAYAAGFFKGYGIHLGGGLLRLGTGRAVYAGSYFAFFFVVMYTGRRYFGAVFRKCFGLRATDEVEPHAVWGARAFLLGMAVFITMLWAVGLDLYLAVLYTFGAVLLFVVVSRVVAETGVYFIHPFFSPCVIILSFLGAKAIGPESLIIMLMVSSLLLIDPREAIMPFVVQGLALADKSGARLGRTASWGAMALVLGFMVALMVTLYIQHDRGAAEVKDGWTYRAVPRVAFLSLVDTKQKLAAQGGLAEAGSLTGAAWLRSISPHWPSVVGFCVAGGLVLLFTVGRLRFSWWPLHPVLFLVLGTNQSRSLAFSFLLGWLIKMGVVRFGGARTVDRLKPLMIGLIAGDMLGGVIAMIIGAAAYAWTGSPPPAMFRVTPG